MGNNAISRSSYACRRMGGCTDTHLCGSLEGRSKSFQQNPARCSTPFATLLAGSCDQHTPKTNVGSQLIYLAAGIVLDLASMGLIPTATTRPNQVDHCSPRCALYTTVWNFELVVVKPHPFAASFQ